MEKKFFGKTTQGVEASLYEISNSKGMRLTATDFGATVVSIFVKDKNGVEKDVVLGYDEVGPFEKETCFFGATVGRNANRIANSVINIDGTEYQLDVNDNENNLHSGKEGTSERMWQVKAHEANKITFTIHDADLQQGFPGNADMDVTYEVTEDNEFKVSYYAVCDKKTVFNMTNHAYFNLNGHESGNVYSQELQLNASHYTPVIDSKAIPTGEIAAVEGTPFDFRVAKPIGKDINADNEQLKFVNGYDHNFALDKTQDGMENIGSVYAPESGIYMEILTDCIGIQLYTGNFIEGQVGKNGEVYVKNGAFCLETQYFPNAVNEANFTTPVTEANVPYESTTIYRFSVK